MYTAVVISKKEQKAALSLLSRIGITPPEGWELVFHHMTVNMGKAKRSMQEKLGLMSSVVLTHVAQDEKVMAFKVRSPTESDNPTKHVTFAVNRSNGGKPYQSNSLNDWMPLQVSVGCVGVIEEIGNPLDDRN